jgi:hypothetical protein
MRPPRRWRCGHRASESGTCAKHESSGAIPTGLFAHSHPQRARLGASHRPAASPRCRPGSAAAAGRADRRRAARPSGYADRRRADTARRSAVSGIPSESVLSHELLQPLSRPRISTGGNAGVREFRELALTRAGAISRPSNAAVLSGRCAGNRPSRLYFLRNAAACVGGLLGRSSSRCVRKYSSRCRRFS